MDNTIIIAIITLCGSLVGTYFANRKSTALIQYRLEELEKKVDKHNNLVERTYELERVSSVREEEMKVCQNRLSDCEVKLDKLVERGA